jgi:tryptophan halogenase
MAARADRFAVPPRDGSLLSELAYAYHFDAGLYAAYLRRYAEARGVRRIEGKIGHVGQDGETGHVTTLHLETGQTVAGEFFIDCSGLAGLLIEKTLNSGYDDWSHWLPCDRAAFVPSEGAENISPYTRSTAHTAGWQWRIPLQHRIGNGHVFSSGYMEDNEAEDLLLQTLDQKPLAAPKFLRFQTGRRKLSWNRNVVAIGLSSGFLEPLESTSIHLIHSGLVKLLDYWPDRTFNPLLIAQYNRAMANQYESIRDFIILHYKATDREDSEFWRYCKHMSVPDSLSYKLDHFRASSRIVLSPGELFQPASWFSVMVGQNVMPTDYDSLADLYDAPDVEHKLTSLQRAIAHTVDAMPTHRQVLAGLRQTAIADQGSALTIALAPTPPFCRASLR